MAQLSSVSLISVTSVVTPSGCGVHDYRLAYIWELLYLRHIVAYQLPHHPPSVVGHSKRTVRDLWVSLRQVSLPFIYLLKICSEILGANFRAHLSDFLVVVTLVSMAF